jgi:hypothetical protein
MAFLEAHPNVASALRQLQTTMLPPKLPPHRELYVGMQCIWHKRLTRDRLWKAVSGMEGLQQIRQDVGRKGPRAFLSFDTPLHAVNAQRTLLRQFPTLPVKLCSPPAGRVRLAASPAPARAAAPEAREPTDEELLNQLLAILLVPLM